MSCWNSVVRFVDPKPPRAWSSFKMVSISSIKMNTCFLLSFWMRKAASNRRFGFFSASPFQQVRKSLGCA